MDNVRLNLKLDRDTHRALKMLAVRTDCTMQDLIESLIKAKLQAGKSA